MNYTNEKKEEYYNLIRVVSTILIFSTHFSASFPLYSISGYNNFFLYTPNTNSALVGVYLFFMLSGSTLICNYSDNFSVVNYYKKRWLKIFPLYYISYSIFFTYCVISEKFLLGHASFSKLIWTLLGMDFYLYGEVTALPIIGEWFTGAIIILYILFPLLRFLFLKNQYTYYLSTAIFFGLYIVDMHVTKLPHPEGVDSIFSQLFYFWLGMMLFRERDEVKKINLSIIVMYGVLLILVPLPFSIYTSSLVGACIIWLVSLHVPIKVYKNNFVFKIINKYSYIIYLIHHQVIYIVMNRWSDNNLPIYKSIIIYFFVGAITIIIAAIINVIYDFLRKAKGTIKRITAKE